MGEIACQPQRQSTMHRHYDRPLEAQVSIYLPSMLSVFIIYNKDFQEFIKERFQDFEKELHIQRKSHHFKLVKCTACSNTGGK